MRGRVSRGGFLVIDHRAEPDSQRWCRLSPSGGANSAQSGGHHHNKSTVAPPLRS